MKQRFQIKKKKTNFNKHLNFWQNLNYYQILEKF